MSSRTRISIAVVISLACTNLAQAQIDLKIVGPDRLAAVPEPATAHQPDSSAIVIPAPGPERGVNVGQRGQIPPYRGFLGSETGNLSVDWVVPQDFVLGREAEFELVMRNHGSRTGRAA